MKNFRNDLIEKINEKLENTNICSSTGYPDGYVWENLESEMEFEMYWNLDGDGKVKLDVDYSTELEYNSLEEAIENIDEIVEFFLERN